MPHAHFFKHSQSTFAGLLKLFCYNVLCISDFVVGRKEDSSVLALIKVPAVLMTGLVVVVISSVWSFLDPTLEPHLRQVNKF